MLDYIIAPQVTSPIREKTSIMQWKVNKEKLDSLLSKALKDFFIWKEDEDKFVSEN